MFVMKKNKYNYLYSKTEHDYKVIKILVGIFIVCVIGLVIYSCFTFINFNTINNSNEGLIGFIQSCASYAFGWII